MLPISPKPSDTKYIRRSETARNSAVLSSSYSFYKNVSKSSRTVLVKRSLLTLDVKFLHYLQSSHFLHEYIGPSVSAMLGSIPGSPFLERCHVPAAIPLESLQWCRIFDPSSEASAWGREKSIKGPDRVSVGGWGITVMLFLAKNCETLKDL